MELVVIRRNIDHSRTRSIYSEDQIERPPLSINVELYQVSYFSTRSCEATLCIERVSISPIVQGMALVNPSVNGVARIYCRFVFDIGPIKEI